MGDSRKEFIFKAIGNYFSLDGLKDGGAKTLYMDASLNRFLDDANCSFLSSALAPSGDVVLSNTLSAGTGTKNALIFFKIRPSVIVPDNLHSDVFFTSLVASPAETLYYAIQKIFSPMLLKDESWSRQIPPKLQELLSELEEGLGNSLHRSRPDTSRVGAEKPEAMAETLSHFYRDSFHLQVLETARVETADEAVEELSGFLDDLWKGDDAYPYPQTRMMHLMDIIGKNFSSGLLEIYASKGDVDIWTMPFAQIEPLLTVSIALSNRWVDACSKLTSLFWAFEQTHPWKGDPYVPTFTAGFGQRMEEILALRTIHRQLTNLLSPAERAELKSEEAFGIFHGIRPELYNPYTAPIWKAAVANFESFLVPAEKRIAHKLRKQLQTMQENIPQLVQEYRRYAALLQHAVIRNELRDQRAHLLTTLTGHVRASHSHFRSKGPTPLGTISGMSELVRTLTWVQQMEGKMKSMLEVADKVLGDLDSGKVTELRESIKTFQEDLAQSRQDQFNSWSQDMLASINDRTLSLSTSQKVVGFQKGRGERSRMVVNYNPDLVTLIREVRQLSALGFAVPRKIQDVTAEAGKYMRQAKALEKVACFHNTIGERIIASQLSLLLEPASKLEELVKQETSITWDDTKAVEGYIQKLQAAVDRLNKDNNKLADFHGKMKAKISMLMQSDLLRQEEKWKEGLQDVRKTVESVTAAGFGEIKGWKNHWDHQLYKALEFQYQVGLAALNQQLPKIRVDLSYSDQHVTFSPPMEDIRKQYYQKLRRFLGRPIKFRGVGGSENPVFDLIVDRNAHKFKNVYLRGEALLSELELLRDSFKPACSLGCVDVEALAGEQLSSAEDYESSFKAVSQIGHMINKLPNGDKEVECFIVSLGPIHEELERMKERYLNSLAIVLQRSIAQDGIAIESFSEEAIEALKRTPQTVEEIGEVNAKHAEYGIRMEDMSKRMENAKQKNKILSKFMNRRVESFAEVSNVWENFATLMGSHQQMISKQVEAIKSNLESQANNFNSEIERFAAKWHQTKPKEDATESDPTKMAAGVKIVREKREEWNLLMETRDKLKADYAHFQLSPPENPQIEEVEADLKKFEMMWCQFEEFRQGMADFEKEEWIVFRGKVYMFEEYLTQWETKLQDAGETTTVTLALASEIEKHKAAVPVLKYVRGEAFSEKHWMEVFNLLGIPTATQATNLTFGQLLKSKEALLVHAEKIKELNDRASAEVIIRQALDKLDVWAFDSRFTFREAQDSQGANVTLIKEWKDIINKVGDHQMVLQSVKDSPYYEAFSGRAGDWEGKLGDLDSFLHNLNQIQRKWEYLEPIFGNKLIPDEKALSRFRRIDSDFRMIMSDIHRDPKEWLSGLSKEMVSTIRNLVVACIQQTRKGDSDPGQFPSQVLCIAEAITFTEKCERAIQKNGLAELHHDMKKQLEALTSAEFDASDADGKVLELKQKALILDTIHAIEVLEALMEAKTRSLDEWIWQKQLRYYMKPDGQVIMRMVDAEFDYTYEYQGNAPKLVHTPLTDKCYLTLTQGMRLGLGGNPYGPAGTGKTESVKALGGLFGRQVLVFNCDEGIDVKSMGRIFVGLVKCGAWGCFDEFNRLEEAVLSAVSMQIQAIQSSIRRKEKHTNLLGKEVDLNPNSGIFITLNPAGKGYGGRQKLPDNLKQLFRPVAMTRPDNDLIAETILYSEGFKTAKVLGSKLVEIFTMSKELLSTQQHYDWGLRALKTVLKGCGSLLKSHSLSDDQKTEGINEQMESEIAVQALRLNTLSKLTFADSLRFDALVKDVFPGIPFKDGGHEELLEHLIEAAKDLGYSENQSQMKKAVEVFEQLQQRMGVVLVGPSGSGKSTLWKILRHALNKAGQEVRLYTINPKAMPRTQLLGIMDADTREWTDGVLTRAARDVVSLPKEIKSWIVCDGDIDPEWIESLNSVLDDNRLLTMPSGERIQFGPNVNFLFETHDLSSASPATISRMGMIFLSDENTDVKAVVQAWIRKQTDDAQHFLPQYIDDYFYQAVTWVMGIGDQPVETSLLGVVLNGLSHLEGVTSRPHFAVGLLRGLGANLSEGNRLKFADQSCKLITTNTGQVLRPVGAEKLILYLKDLNLPKPDKWGTSQLIAFLQQLVTYEGYYSADLEWVGLEGIQVVGSLVSSSGLGRHALSPRFTSIVRIAHMSEPDRNELSVIYQSYLEAVLEKVVPSGSRWASSSGAEQLASAMIALYGKLRETFSADDYSHYSFAPRDLTRWSLALLRYSMTEDNHVVESWAYEACRLFRDRMVGQKDVSRFDDLLREIIGSQLGQGELVTRLTEEHFVTWGARGADTGGPKPGVATLPPLGKPLGRMERQDFEQTMEKGIARFNREQFELDVLLFPELLRLMSSMDRVLTRPGGSALMIGRAGVGRRPAAGVIACMHGLTVYMPRVTAGYAFKHFAADLKQAMTLVAVEGHQLALILEDHHLVDPACLEMVNSLLAAGEVPGLFPPEEMEPLLSKIKQQASHEGFRGPPLAFFSLRVQRDLHVVLILDSSDEALSARCDSNPALIKESTVIWMDDWSDESKMNIPAAFLTRTPPGEDDPPPPLSSFLPEGGSQIFPIIPGIHGSAPDQDRTPKKYMDFIRTFSDIIKKKRNAIETRKAHLQAGVKKLQESRTIVAKLQQEAAEDRKVCAAKQAEANEAMSAIKRTMASATNQKSEMENLKEITAKEEANIKERKKAIDLELAEVEPMIQQAKSAVGNIKNEALSEIRSMRAPPDTIRDILEGVLRLMGIQDTSWNSMKSFLAKRGVKEEIKTFDARKITSESLKGVEKLLKSRPDSFESAVAKRASTAAEPLAAWVKANVTFARVVEKIRPLEKEQSKLQSNLKSAEEQMAELTTGLDDVDKKVTVLREKFEQSTKEATIMEIKLQEATNKISVASDLVGKLEGEFTRWTEQVEEMTHELGSLPYQALIGSAFLTYLPSQPEDMRKSLTKKWADMVGLDPSTFELKSFLANESAVLSWKAEGLPHDELSVDNAVMITEAAVGPLLVDPSGRATSWLIKHLENEGKVETISLTDRKLQTSLELGVEFGKTLVLTEVDSVPPVLLPILRRDIVTQGGPQRKVTVGERVVDFNPKFRLYMTTQNGNPDIPPGIRAAIAPINFATTRAGLTGQLLAAALLEEKPDLEKQRQELLSRQEELRVSLLKLEDTLLDKLANAQGNLLDDSELLASLTEMKSSASTIAESLEQGQQVKASLEAEGNVYQPLAENGSRLFFVISDLIKINNMYNFSLNTFMDIFHQALRSGERTESDTEQRVLRLQQSLLHLTVSSVSQALFKGDRLMCALHIAHGMKPNFFKNNEWEAFTGTLAIDLRMDLAQMQASLPSWINQERAVPVAILKATFPELASSLSLDNGSVWSEFASHPRCEEALPGDFRQSLTPFQQLLVVQALRPDRLQSAMEKFAAAALGLTSLALPPLSLNRILQTSRPTEPVLFLITTGADPSQEIREMARHHFGNQSINEKYFAIAMGQGQAELTLKKLEECASQGLWLCLQNLHLVTAWLPTLYAELMKLNNPHENFRLWLTAEAHPKFSPMLLQMCKKISFEAPAGVKRNLERTYDAWRRDMGNDLGGSVLGARSLMALAWFHAVLQERRSYIPQSSYCCLKGWSKFYEFSFADLRVGKDVLDRVISRAQQGDPRWRFIHELFVNAVYGGRVDNPFDLQVLSSYTNEIFNSDNLSEHGQPRRPLGGIISLPGSTDVNAYLQVIKGMPDDDTPSYFGLPDNIQGSLQRNISTQVNTCFLHTTPEKQWFPYPLYYKTKSLLYEVINQLRIVMRSAIEGAHFDRHKWNKELGPVLNLWKKLNQGTTLHSEKLVAPSLEGKDSLQAFALLERYNAVSLVQRIHRSLAALSKVLNGSILLSGPVASMAKELMKQETPTSWASAWNGPTDPMAYLRSVVLKANAIGKWVQWAEQNTLTNQTLDLGELLNPNTFLTALRQQTARTYNGQIAMDGLVLSNSWGSGISGAKLPIRIGGLLLEGCRFEGGALRDNKSDSPIICPLPDVTVAWVPKDASANRGDDQSVVRLPVYRDAEREFYLTQLTFPSGGHPEHWLQTGAALFVKA
ncbi:unnamed protein product [Cyprideis torosa]|uniref:Cytoplasmic dynein 2 heavy chain 1 n=1 Tax=Cyprideis torosa TaxID=163714 RepID=A0A7R8W8E4_9CRUS|nr:unnamed protein product [Cyprideis torosa]CAG0883700.1 unnamed protein product [Cyprideis torosa]